MVNRPVIIAKGKFVPTGNETSGAIGPPGSGSTITLYDSTKDFAAMNIPAAGVPFSRFVFTLNSSADSGASGVVFSEALDGVNFDSTDTKSYTTASGLTAFDFLVRSPGASVKLTYQNSAAVLTVWRFVLTGILGDRNPGA
jgi:hypothetical protein